MNHQQSFRQKTSGALYLVPTPIGNLEDMTYRAVRVLQDVDKIFAEDTRHTRKLCHYFEISTPLDSYHEHSAEGKGSSILTLLEEGRTAALVSDAGTPLVSDPGRELVQQALEQDIAVIPLPGANAAVTAWTASGLGGGPFYFYGFLPRKKKDRQARLDHLSGVNVPILFYESPYRLKEMLSHLEETWGNRRAVLARELTKQYEEILRGTLPEIARYVHEHTLKGECCVIVEGTQEETAAGDTWWEALEPRAHVQVYVEQGMTSKEAIKAAAKDRGVPKQEVYAAYHHL
ncbi:16S rRNA (cytidine(1402)-2'-O)-methyltransferase [Salibacterium halotolerans]|uniref:Ribosomal RNA small subunit methyltransferase I n=1 Tax=Salibacterium halotolerans TaxID=1884432 RepID=A0A1I5WN68_9BACI|nr:16S rRNA (cytidine(1402)-2'-O)-methyltransferase [Salibacterium halotolerans]SFQ21149.1 16S rRNA (cytidine1402-2'-O)-methyltransferase [Salibacterium halotolerans]